MPRPNCDLFGPIFTVKDTSLARVQRKIPSLLDTLFEGVVIPPKYSRCDATGLSPHTLPAKVLRVAQEESRPPERARVCAATNTASYRREPWHWRSSPTRSHARTDTHASAGRACTHEHTPTNTAQHGAPQHAAHPCSYVMSFPSPFIIIQAVHHFTHLRN